MKKTIITVCLLAMMFALAACRGGDGGAPATPATPAPPAPATPAPATPAPQAEVDTEDELEEIEIRVAWWGDTVRNDLYMEILETFTDAFPHISVIPEPISWGDYIDRLTVQVAGGNAPDFISMNPQFSSEFILRGVLEPLDRFVADGTLDFTGWQEGVINTGRHEGRLYLVPMGVAVFANYLNVGMFNELGVRLPDRIWYWDDVRAIGLEAREALDAAGMNNAFFFGDWTADISLFRFYVRSYGYELWTPEGGLGIGPEVLQSFWNMFAELRELRIVPDAATGAEFAGATLETNMFSRQRVMVAETSANQFPMWNRTFPDKEIALQRFPQMQGAPVTDFPSGSTFAVASTSPEPRQRAAVQLINHWVNSPESLYLFRLDQGIPGNEAQHHVFVPYLNIYQQQLMEFSNWVLSEARPTVFPARGSIEVTSLFSYYGERVAFGMMSIEEASELFVQEATEALARHQQD